MKKILLFLFMLHMAANMSAQEEDVFNYTWYLHYLIIDGEYIPAPQGQDFHMTILPSGENFTIIANGIENELEGDLVYNQDDSFTFTNIEITTLDCNTTICDFEEQYFDEFFDNTLNTLPTLNYGYSDYFYPNLTLIDEDGNQAYYGVNNAVADPALYQTWYLIAQHSDLGPSYSFTPSTERQLTINPDLSFTATDNCATRTGHFVYQEVDDYYYILPVFHAINTDNCEDGETYGTFWELGDSYDLRMEVYSGGDSDFFTFEAAPGFGNDFTNQLLSIEDVLINSIKLHPNPVSETLQISSNEIQLSSIEILSLQGKVLTTEIDNLQEINLSHLSSGVYFIKLISEENSVIKKIIKN